MTKSAKTLGIKPLAGYILVLPSESETKTASGILLPESTQEKPTQGEVVAIGAELVFENGKSVGCPVQVGDIVVYKKWGGDEIKSGGVEYKIVKFEDLMAVVEK